MVFSMQAILLYKRLIVYMISCSSEADNRQQALITMRMLRPAMPHIYGPASTISPGRSTTSGAFLQDELLGACVTCCYVFTKPVLRRISETQQCSGFFMITIKVRAPKQEMGMRLSCVVSYTSCGYSQSIHLDRAAFITYHIVKSNQSASP